MTSMGEQHPTALHFSVDGRQGVLRASDIAASFGLPMALANSADYRQWPHPSPRDMVRLLSRDTAAGTILLRRQLPPGMIFVDHVLWYNLFPLQHWVQRQGAILEALYRISEGFWFSPAELVMTTLFHFEEKVHCKSLSRAKAIPLLFPRLISQLLEHMGFPDEPRLERRRVCTSLFTVHKWKFLPRSLPLPLEEPPEEQQPDSADDFQMPTHSPPVATESLPASAGPSDAVGPSTPAPSMGFIQITPRDFLAIMDAVRTFSATSASFATVHAALAERMARAEVALVHPTAILEQIQIHLGLPHIPLSIPAATQHDAIAPLVTPDPHADPLDLLAAAAVVPSPVAHPVQDADDSSPTSLA